MLEAVVRAAYPILGPKKLHRGQWAVLRYLAEAGHGARTINDVAEHLGVTHAPASRAVSALVRQDMVTLVAGSRDRRTRHVELTTKGKSLLKSDPALRLSAAIDGLGPQRRERLGITLSLLHARMAAKPKQTLR